MPDFKTEVANLQEIYRDATESTDSDPYEKLLLFMQDLSSELRGYLYASNALDLRELLTRIQRGDALSGQDKDLLKVWVVEDAEKYMQMEGHFKGWLAELESIMEEVGKLARSEPGLDDIGRLRALLYSGSRILADIMFYLRASNRVENFNQSIEDFNEETRTTMVTVLKRRLDSVPRH